MNLFVFGVARFFCTDSDRVCKIIIWYSLNGEDLSCMCVAYGYTSNEVECNRKTGRCSCRDGYKEDSRSCRRCKSYTFLTIFDLPIKTLILWCTGPFALAVATAWWLSGFSNAQQQPWKLNLRKVETKKRTFCTALAHSTSSLVIKIRRLFCALLLSATVKS